MREGLWADVVVFDAETVNDQASFSDPHRFPQGIIHVIINGEFAVESSRQTENLPGKILRARAGYGTQA